MACLAMVSATAEIVGHVCQTDSITKPVPRHRKKSWWCFACRKRFVHTFMGSYPIDESYYGPSFWWECPRCHEEHVLFPGREWVVDE